MSPRSTPAALRRARPAGPRNRLLSWISGEYPEEAAAAEADAKALAPPDLAVRREILRLELEAEVANLQAEADAMMADAVEEGRVIEVPEELRPFASIESIGDETTDAGAAEGEGAPSAPAEQDGAAATDETTTEDGAPRRGLAAQPESAWAPASATSRLSCRRCPTDYLAPAPRSSASSRSASPTGPTGSGWPGHPMRPMAGGSRSCGSPTTTAWSASPTSHPAPGRRPIRPSADWVPASSGALSGLILEDAGRLQMRLGLVAPPDDPTRPWRAPLAIRAAFRFEPARAATMRPNELAETVANGVPASHRGPPQALIGPPG